jgi:hypothetical protein
MIDKKTCEVYSLWFFEELLELIGISRGVLIKRKLHHRLWRLPYTEVLVCYKQRVEVIPSNLSVERSWVPFCCWVSLFLTGFTSVVACAVMLRTNGFPFGQCSGPRCWAPCDVNPVKNNETQQRKGTQDRSMDRFEGMTSTRCL